jgi:hypothetical protein
MDKNFKRYFATASLVEQPPRVYGWRSQRVGRGARPGRVGRRGEGLMQVQRGECGPALARFPVSGALLSGAHLLCPCEDRRYRLRDLFPLLPGGTIRESSKIPHRGLGCGIRHCRLVGQLARVDHQKASLGHVEAPVSVLHWHAADDTLPMPASRRLLPRPAWLFEQQGQCTLLLAPRLHLLAHRTGAPA